MPAGHVSFRAKVGKDRALRVSGYPSQMGVSARFAGEGCMAEQGYERPTWCTGELLTFGDSCSPQFAKLTGGASLGFVWNVAHAKRFLILLSRLEDVSQARQS